MRGGDVIRLGVSSCHYYGRQINFMLWIENTLGGEDAVAQPVTMVKVTDPGLVYPPTFSLPLEAVKILMQDLWNAGFRPNEYGTTGHVSSLESHLKDMRTIVFDHFLKQLAKG